MPALVTPFRDGAVDEKAFVALVERQIAGGVHGVVPVGTTGETATLSHEEHRRVVELAVKTAAGRVPVMKCTCLVAGSCTPLFSPPSLSSARRWMGFSVRRSKLNSEPSVFAT